MAYPKTNWANGTTPAISADNLNKIENELGILDDAFNNLNIVSMDALPTTKGIPSSDGGWQLTASNKYLHVVIPVHGGEKIHILSNASQYSYMSVLTNYYGTSQNPVYCTQSPFDERLSILNGSRTYNYTLPSTARYIVFVVLYNDIPALPQKFEIDGYDLVKTSRENFGDVYDKFDDLNGVRTWYVNASTGADTNDGLSAATAFATIQKAIDSIGSEKKTTPSTGGDYCQAIISVASGTYDKFVVDGKTILFQSDGTITISTSANIAVLLKNGANINFNCPVVINQSGAYNSVSIRTNSCARFLNTLTITNSSTAITVSVVGDSLFFVNGVLTITATSSTAQCIYAQHSARVVIVGNNSSIDCGGTGIYAQNGSFVTLAGRTFTIGNHTSTGLRSDGSAIYYRAITNNATTKQSTYYGGRIYTETQTEIDSKGTVAANTDLNTITKSGVYLLNGTYTNVPDVSNTYYGSSTTKAVLFVTNPNPSGGSGNTVQTIMYDAPIAIFHRYYSGSSWKRWNSYASNTFSYLKDCDLNDIKDEGLYILNPTTYTYTNYPFSKNINSAMFVLRGFSDSHAVIQILYPLAHSVTPMYRPNVETGDTWVAFGETKDTSFFAREYSHDTFEPIVTNPRECIKLRVGTMNIGHFNYGNSNYYGIPTAEYDVKLHNWRKFLCANQFDIFNINEFVPYIDYLAKADYLTGSKLTTEYLLKPQFSYFDSSMETDANAAVITSKYPISDENGYVLTGTTNNGSCKYMKVTIDENHIIGVYGVQLVFLSASGDTYDSAASIANRLAQLDSLASVIASNEDDYIIIMGDFNTGTSTDLANVKDFCSDNNLVPCNGGFLDWLRTHESFKEVLCLDNILVSENIHINDFYVYEDWYSALSTDHYGIGAEIVLT